MARQYRNSADSKVFESSQRQIIDYKKACLRLPAALVGRALPYEVEVVTGIRREKKYFDSPNFASVFAPDERGGTISILYGVFPL